MDIWQAKRTSTAELEAVVRERELEIARLRSDQLAAIGELAVRRADVASGCRSMVEYVASRADVATETASSLVRTAAALNAHPRARFALGDGEISFDRAAALAADEFEPEGHLSLDLDIAALRRQTAMHRRLTRRREHEVFADRYLVFQPTLDGASGRLHGRLPGMAYRVVEKAIHERGDEFPEPPGDGYRRSQRNADALVAMAEDSLDRSADGAGGGGGAQVSVVVDATASGDGVAAEVEYGPMVGPAALEAALCTGSVRVIGIAAGRPVATSATSRAIAPAIRAFVAHRDGGCCADGCTSRYRLQPHHIVPYRHGASHDPDNLVTLCWFHHHVVCHGMGFDIDPDSPRRRIRFTRCYRRAPP